MYQGKHYTEKSRRRKAGNTAVTVGILLAVLLLCALPYFRVRLSVRTELGEGLPDASVFLRSGGEASYTRTAEISSREEGSYLLFVKHGFLPRPVLLRVRDTVPPAAEAEELRLAPGSTLSPRSALLWVEDASDCSFAWKEAPDLSIPGTCRAEVLIRDAGGNETAVPVQITVSAVKERVKLEAGEPLPDASAFAIAPGTELHYAGGIPAVDTTVPGEYTVSLICKGTEVTSLLCVQDTVPPAFTLRSDCYTQRGHMLTPEELVAGCEDVTPVSYFFSPMPDWNVSGTVECTVTALDGGGNVSTQTAQFEIYDRVIRAEADRRTRTLGEVLREVGEALPEDLDPTALEQMSVVGDALEPQPFSISRSGGTYRLLLLPTDTAAPEAQPVNRTLYANYPIEASEFVTDIRDRTTVTVTYDTEPDWNLIGTQGLTLLLTDAAGNTATLHADLTLKADTEAPRIYAGQETRHFVTGETVAYFSQITVTDNADSEVNVTVDKSAVNPRKPGTYPVTYTATDRAGNSTALTLQFVFTEPRISKETLTAAIEEWLGRITEPDMTRAEKLREAYFWIQENVNYDGFSNKNDPVYEAYRALTTYSGDCISTNALAAYVLEYLGVDTLWVERIDGWGPHYWIMANFGTGWYHIDAMPYSGARNYQVLMATAAELDGYDPTYWKYAKELYPTPADTDFHDPENPEDTYDWAYPKVVWY